MQQRINYKKERVLKTSINDVTGKTARVKVLPNAQVGNGFDTSSLYMTTLDREAETGWMLWHSSKIYIFK